MDFILFLARLLLHPLLFLICRIKHQNDFVDAIAVPRFLVWLIVFFSTNYQMPTKKSKVNSRRSGMEPVSTHGVRGSLFLGGIREEKEVPCPSWRRRCQREFILGRE